MRWEPKVMCAIDKAGSGPRQRGAALVIGLILLLVLTLLAVSGMSSASLEFIMAGNEQYRANAFQASESGIEQSMILGSFNPGAAAQALNGANTATDLWTSTIRPQLNGAPLPAVWGFSWNSFSSYHFEIQSTGSSIRGGQALNFQGVAVIAPFDPSVTPDGLLGTTQLN